MYLTSIDTVPARTRHNEERHRADCIKLLSIPDMATLDRSQGERPLLRALVDTPAADSCHIAIVVERRCTGDSIHRSSVDDTVAIQRRHKATKAVIISLKIISVARLLDMTPFARTT